MLAYASSAADGVHVTRIRLDIDVEAHIITYISLIIDL